MTIMNTDNTLDKTSDTKNSYKQNTVTDKQRYTKKNLNGILLLDKPTGITSNAALQAVKRLFQARKAGHTGSLDPLACGMLPICFGEATKFSQFLLDSDKHYLVIAKLGIKTTTADAEGDIVERKPVEEYSSHAIQTTLAQFRGAIEQIPSMYSAIKHNGVPLYKLARQGITVERKSREVRIHELTLLDQKEDTLTLEVRCTKGTYIRTLVEDIGEALGCGAHVIYLRRLAVGHYNEQQMQTMQHLESTIRNNNADALVLPIETTVKFMPSVILAKAAEFYLRQGQSVMVPQSPTSGYVRLYSSNDIFIGVGELLDNGKVAPSRLLGEVK